MKLINKKIDWIFKDAKNCWYHKQVKKAIKESTPIERNRIIEIIEKWFLGKRKGKASNYLFCKKGILPYSQIRELKARIER